MQIIKPTDARRRQAVPGVDGLLPALVGHADVGPAREEVFGIPLALPVSYKTILARRGVVPGHPHCGASCCCGARRELGLQSACCGREEGGAECHPGAAAWDC